MSYAGMDVGGATLGIIGMGWIGEAVARRAKGFDVEVCIIIATGSRTQKRSKDLN